MRNTSKHKQNQSNGSRRLPIEQNLKYLSLFSAYQYFCIKISFQYDLELSRSTRFVFFLYNLQ